MKNTTLKLLLATTSLSGAAYTQAQTSVTIYGTAEIGRAHV